MDMNCISPYIRVARDSIVQQNIRLRDRVIFDYELIYIKSGEVELTVVNHTYYCRPGDIIFLQPRTPHSTKTLSSSPIHQPHVHFDLFSQPDSPYIKVSFRPLSRILPAEMKLFRPPLSVPGVGAPPVLLRLQNSSTFEHKLYKLIREANSMLPYSDMAVKGLFIDLWTHYLREVYWNQNTTVPTTMTTVSRVREYLDAHLERDVSLAELAGHVHLSKYYISHLFKKIYNISPMQYHQTARIDKAKELVQFSDMPIRQISEQMGYLNVGSFSRAFKAVENVPPSFYR